MTVSREDDALLVDDRELASELGEDEAVLLGHGVADGVGDVDGRRAGVDDGGGDVDEVVDLGAAAVLGGELDVVDVAAGLLDALDGDAGDLVEGLLELVLAVDGRGGAEGVDAGAVGVLHGFAGAVDVPRHAAGEAGDDGVRELFADGLDGLEVALGGDGEAGLDDVDAEGGELPGDLDLLPHVERGAGRLLAVAERGVEDADGRGGFGGGCVGHGDHPWRCGGSGLAHVLREGSAGEPRRYIGINGNRCVTVIQQKTLSASAGQGESCVGWTRHPIPKQQAGKAAKRGNGVGVARHHFRKHIGPIRYVNSSSPKSCVRRGNFR